MATAPAPLFAATDSGVRRSAPRRIALSACLGLALMTVPAAPGLASASEEQQGALLLQSLQAKRTSCARLSRQQFELIGEYVMGRMLGSTAAHEAMNARMRNMMGSSGAAQAHVYMGQRFAGCAAGSAPGTFSSMMGMMAGYAANTGSMMGHGQGGSGMMGRSVSGTSYGNGWSSADTVMVILMGILLAAVAGALAAWRPWRRPRRTSTTPGGRP